MAESYVALVHWNEAECRERAERLSSFGYEVFAHWRQDDGGALTRRFARRLPLAVVVDLGRLPSHGRSVVTWLRERKSTRRVPVVVVPGDPAKTDRMRNAFPDAVYSGWTRMRSALAKAIANPPKNPVVPAAADYSGTPLPKKLGLREDGVLAVVRPPQDWATTLGTLPAGAVQKRGLRGERNVVVLFCRALAELRADWPTAANCLAEGGGLWVAWPKKASGLTTDLTDAIVRAFGLDCGWVDNKVCAIDATWSGLRFARRRQARS